MEHRDNVLEQLFGVSKPVVAMIHVLPLPGSPRGRNCDLRRVYEHAAEEARLLESLGLDGVLLENAGDVPFLKPDQIGFETVSAMAVVGDRVRAATSLPMGFNIVANAAVASIACARASGAQFVRVNQWANAYIANEGYVEGAAATALRYRSQIGADDVAVFADVHVKHGSHAIVADRAIAEQARDVEFFGADVLVATGSRTGSPTSLDELREVQSGTSRPVLIGSGLNPDNAVELLGEAAGAILGSWARTSNDMWGPLDPGKIQRLMREVETARRGYAALAP